MPWNSSKSGVNFTHAAFQNIRPTLIQFVSHFSSLSRRLKNDWPNKVLKYKSDTTKIIDPLDIATKKKLVLPPLPRVNKPAVEKLKATNKKVIQNQPWTLGLIEAVAVIDVIQRQSLETKNRISLILLDSNFEIALKEFIVHRQDLFPYSQYNDAKIQTLFNKRPDVIREVSAKIPIPQSLVKRAQHYYLMRNKLIHERATVGVTDADISNYKDTIEKMMKILFGVNFSKGS